MSICKAGTITFAATPIGNIADASPRLCAALQEADIIAAEDTRRALDLCQRLQLKPLGKLLSFHDHNEGDRSEFLLECARADKSVLVISDAGMPGVSDPGYRLQQAAIAAGVPTTVIPGPSAVLTALVLSGLPTDRFSFEGFVPRKENQIRARAQQLKTDPRTAVWFESPRRVAQTLEIFAAELGAQRPAAICRELTKTHEEVIRGTLGELCALDAAIRGEVVLVISGGSAAEADPAVAVPQVQRLVEDGMKLKAAVGLIAQNTGLRKNDLYRAVLAAREK